MTTITGTGVAPSRKYPAINRRVEQLGLLNDRHRDARNNQDAQALEQIAKEYEGMGCKQRAEEIRLEIGGRKQRRPTGYASGTKRSSR